MTFDEWWEQFNSCCPLDITDEEIAKWAWDEATEQAVNSKLTPEGYVLVPVEPTEKMIEAGDALWDHHCTSIYEAMIHAAQEQE